MSYPSEVAATTATTEAAIGHLGRPARPSLEGATPAGRQSRSRGIRWVGVVARYDDPDNLMYVTLRANNILSLRRYIDDVLVVLAEKPYPVNIGTWYTVRIEVVKGWTRVYVNNRLELATTADPGPPTVDPILQKGQVGLWMYKATAEYDDFLAYQP